MMAIAERAPLVITICSAVVGSPRLVNDSAIADCSSGSPVGR